MPLRERFWSFPRIGRSPSIYPNRSLTKFGLKKEPGIITTYFPGHRIQGTSYNTMSARPFAHCTESNSWEHAIT